MLCPLGCVLGLGLQKNRDNEQRYQKGERNGAEEQNLGPDTSFGHAQILCGPEYACLVQKSIFTVNVFAILMATALAAAVPADIAGTVQADAKVVLARTARSLGMPPDAVHVQVISVQDAIATCSWTAEKHGGTVHMQLRDGRWYLLDPPGAVSGPRDTRVLRGGGVFAPLPDRTAGYGITVRYSPSDATPGANFSFVYGRTPSPAEFLPYPTTYGFTSDSVAYFDLTVDSNAPIHFSPGTEIEVWFPFVLDDRLRYDFFLDGAQPALGPIVSDAFDNTLHFTLPAFTVTPGKELMSEIDGTFH